MGEGWEIFWGIWGVSGFLGITLRPPSVVTPTPRVQNEAPSAVVPTPSVREEDCSGSPGTESTSAASSSESSRGCTSGSTSVRSPGAVPSFCAVPQLTGASRAGNQSSVGSRPKVSAPVGALVERASERERAWQWHRAINGEAEDSASDSGSEGWEKWSDYGTFDTTFGPDYMD